MYDTSIFTPEGPNQALALQIGKRFISSNQQQQSKHPYSNALINKENQLHILRQNRIPIDLDQRHNSPFAIVGYCCHEHQGENKECSPQKFVTDIAEGTFQPINREIIYQQCTKNGLAPKFMINPYSNVSMKQQRYNIMEKVKRNINVTIKHIDAIKIWYKPDILLCQGYFYDSSIIHHRSDTQQISLNHQNLGINPDYSINIAYDVDNYDVNVGDIKYSDNLKYSLRISNRDNKLFYHHNRSFLFTYNTEFWGGGQCKRYDVIIESIFDRTLHGCITVYVPASFFFESDRMNNNINELILPQNIAYNSENNGNFTFSFEQQLYINSILKFKQNRTKFAMFLVRDCYKKKYHIDAVLRVIFFDMLNETYKKSDALGGCRRDWDLNKELGSNYCPKNAFNGHYLGDKYNCPGYGWTDGVVQMAKEYKFFIAFENSKFKGYSTEKIFNAFYANTIPIYFGDPMITQYVNKNRFIQCNIPDHKISKIREFDRNLDLNTLISKVKPIVNDNMVKCIEKVKYIDNNDKIYYKMLIEPVFVNNTYKNTVIDPEIIGKKMRNALKLHESYMIG